jgi:predicted nucleic acid-binding protein
MRAVVAMTPADGPGGEVDIMTSHLCNYDVMSTKQITIGNVTVEMASRLKELARVSFRLGTHEKMNRQALDEFLGESFVHVVPVTRDVSRIYGQLLSDLRTRGRPIPTNDVWIAACTITSGATLLTTDGDFKKVKGLSCLLLRV